uniref:CDT1 Geminin-binding domain-containing protein n=1 Tax=Strongyloides stercoralis TaxID=6248 RepID=A0AAF5D994_STRER
MFTKTTVRTFGDFPCVLNLFVTPENAGRFLCDQGIFPSTMDCPKYVGAVPSNKGSPLDKVLQCLYYSISGASTTQIIGYTQISKPTIATLNKYTCQLLADAVDLSDVTIGGPGIIVEIEESKFGKVKYHRGHRVEGAWVLGGVERTEENQIRYCFTILLVPYIVAFSEK